MGVSLNPSVMALLSYAIKHFYLQILTFGPYSQFVLKSLVDHQKNTNEPHIACRLPVWDAWLILSHLQYHSPSSIR